MIDIEIIEGVKDCIKQVKGDYFEYDEHLISGGYISSIDLFKIIIEIEKKFRIKFKLDLINPERFDNTDSIAETIKDVMGNQVY